MVHAQKRPAAGGETVYYYPSLPFGYATYAARIAPDGKHRTKRLREEPHKGHNRWHPDIPPVIALEPRAHARDADAMDLQIGPRTTAKDLEKLKRTVRIR